MKIYSLEIFPLKNGDFSLNIYSRDFSIEVLEILNEDFSLKNSFGDFSFEK